MSGIPENSLDIFRSALDNLEYGVFISYFDETDKGRHGTFYAVNDYATKRLGYSKEEILQLNARSINPPGNNEAMITIGKQLKRDRASDFHAIHVGKDGTHHPVAVKARLFKVGGSTFIVSFCDYTNEQSPSEQMDSRFGRLLEFSWDEIYVFSVDTLDIIHANSGAMNNLGYSKEQILSLKITDILQDINHELFHQLTQSLFSGEKSQIIFESILRRSDGSYYQIEMRIQLSHSEVPPVFLANVQDITERKRNEQDLQYLANYDALTGLLNRSMFIDRLNQAIENTRRNNKLIAVIFIDLDSFKHINDTLGHDAGDKLLIEVASRLQDCVRSSDTVARLGGDEFIIILSNLSHVDDVHHVASKIIKTISSPCNLDDHTIKTTCSLGITLYPFDETDTAYELIKKADAAMYHAKAGGKNKYSFYYASLAQDEFSRREMELHLKSALENNEFELYFQPRVDLRTGNINSAEALLRWNHPRYRGVSPAEFIPILETTGQILEVDSWVFKTTCMELKKWIKDYPDLKISVNLSARQFESNKIIENIRDIIDETGVPGKNLEIEITEGVLISKTKEARITLNQIKGMGMNISLDDFGTGYSSLSYLRQLPIDRLKIDRSFVMDLDSNEDSHKIVEAIISLAFSLNLAVTAEGIEEASQAEKLRQLHCYEGQGYYFSKPVNVNEFNKLLIAETHK